MVGKIPPALLRTGPTLSEKGLAANLKLWEGLKDVDVKKIAILGEKPASDTGDLKIYIAGPGKDLSFAGASITWIANKQGEVLHARRNDLYDAPSSAVSVIEFLQSKD